MNALLKRFAKLMVSAAFFLAQCVANIIRRITGRGARGSAVILYYHSIRPEERVRFARQMDTLLRWTRPVDVEFRSSLRGGQRVAAVTFDDGFRSFAEVALPELEQRGIPSTLFVVSERLGCYPDWDEFIHDPSFSEPILTRQELLQLPRNLVTIGSHTLTHPFLTRIEDADAKRELSESRRQLEQMTGLEVDLFSFPHGDFNEDLIKWCKEAGYRQVFTILPESAFCESREYAIGRVTVNPNDWQLEFVLKLLGAYSWLPLAFSLKRKLLLRNASRRLPIRSHAG